MAQTSWESIKAEGSAVLDKLKDLIHQGNIRRVRVRQGDRIIAEFPLTVGVVGTVIAPVAAALGALTAVLADCSIEVEKTAPPAATAPDTEIVDDVRPAV